MAEKPIYWRGTSLDDLKDFTARARKEAGHQLSQVQAGLDPDNWKPFNEAGTGVREIRVTDADGWFRVMYVAKFPEGIYVLHCFQKKSKSGIATPKADMDIIRARLKVAEVLAQELRNAKRNH